MEPTFLDFQFAVPIYGMQGPSHARALVSVPANKQHPLPVIVLLEGRAHLYEHDSSGRQLFDNGVEAFILVTPKVDGDDALLSRTNSREDWRFAEDALWHLVTESLFEVDRRFEVGTVDFSRIYCTGYSLGGDSCFGLAALPGVGRLLAGLVPFACRGEESLVYTPAGLDEFQGLRIWGVQNATERREWKMHWMVKNLHKLADGEGRAGEEDRDWEEVPFEAAWLEGGGTVRKYVFGAKEVWEISDSTSATWTQRGLRYKHHNCWTDVMKFGVLGRRVTSWMLEGSNPHVDVAGELSYSLVLRRPLCGCVRAASCTEPVPWEHADSTACKARRLGLWASPEGVVGANLPWKDGCAPAHGKRVWVGDEIVAWEERSGVVQLQLRRGRHLAWRPAEQRPTFEGATCTSSSDADFFQWFPAFEGANQLCFQRRCLGNFDVATRWSDARCVEFSKRGGRFDSIEAESTAAETEEEGPAAPIDPRLRAQADRERRVFLSSRFCLSMLCRGALDRLLHEYKCQLPEDAGFYSKTEALREAAKNRVVHEEFHLEPWRWVNRIRRALRDARQPWLQMSVLNDRLGLDKAGVPVTKRRLARCEDSDLFCFMEERARGSANLDDTGKKAQKELFVGLISECAKRYPEEYKVWAKPEKSQPSGARFCELCAASDSEKRKKLASTHDARFCKFAPKP